MVVASYWTRERSTGPLTNHKEWEFVRKGNVSAISIPIASWEHVCKEFRLTHSRLVQVPHRLLGALSLTTTRKTITRHHFQHPLPNSSHRCLPRAIPSMKLKRKRPSLGREFGKVHRSQKETALWSWHVRSALILVTSLSSRSIPTQLINKLICRRQQRAWWLLGYPVLMPPTCTPTSTLISSTAFSVISGQICMCSGRDIIKAKKISHHSRPLTFGVWPKISLAQPCVMSANTPF